MRPEVDLFVQHLRVGTGEVTLDIPGPQSSPDEGVARGLARSRQAAINRGDRVARLVKRGPSVEIDPNPVIEMAVTENEARMLLTAGARWVGPDLYQPVVRPHIEQLVVRDYRCVKHADIRLTPLHAFIGPNDSGKSTLLSTIAAMTAGGLGGITGSVTAVSGAYARTQFPSGGAIHLATDDVTTHSLTLVSDATARNTVVGATAPARVLRLDPDTMRAPSSLIRHGSPLEYDARGSGLAAVYDALLSRQIDMFLEISRRFAELFPTAKSIQLTNPTETTKALGVQLLDGRSVQAEQLSEGMLYWLAFAALPYLERTAIVLVEEPENGLHPSRIAEVMRVLRSLSSTMQVIIATHHPLVINEMQPDEVTIVTRTTEKGTIATPLAETKNFRERSKVYALGELWLNYADGNLESELVTDTGAVALS